MLAYMNPLFSPVYPIFIFLLILCITRLEYNETGKDPYSYQGWLKAQEKLHKKWQRQEKIRELKRKAEKQLDKIAKRKKDKNNVRT